MNNSDGTANSLVDVRTTIGLWIISLMVYFPLLGHWCLSGDEFYTYEDSTYSIRKMLSFNSRPLYFIICHYLLKWNPGLPVEVVIRIPAAFFASLMAPCLYVLLCPRRYGNVGLFAALLSLCNPWIFQMSQYGRYYAVVIFFAMLATVAALRFLERKQSRVWPALFLVSGLLAGVSHPPAILIIPAGIAGWICGRLREEPKHVMVMLRKYGLWLLGALLFGAAVGLYFLQNVIKEWMGAAKGGFGGSYDVPGILISLVLVGGLSTWVVAIVPLLRFPTSWSARDAFLLAVLLVGGGPLLLLVPFGGGVSSNYLLFILPCVFLLAARHWRQMDERLPSYGYRLALGLGIVACNAPQLLSMAADGNHFDHRTMAHLIEDLNIENPVIFSSGHLLTDYYLDDRYEVESNVGNDLGEFGRGVPREIIQRAIAMATEENRPLLLVSRQDRRLLSLEDQAWLYSRFAVLRTVETPRYDHRRHRVVLYQYRPMDLLAGPTRGSGGSE